MNRTDRVAQRFAKAHQSYSNEARIQQHMAAHLRCCAQAHLPQNLSHVLEIGCGTGQFSQQLLQSFQIQQLTLNDLVQVADFAVPSSTQWLLGDIEQLPLPNGLQAIVSNAALQWLQDLPRLWQRCARALQSSADLHNRQHNQPRQCSQQPSSEQDAQQQPKARMQGYLVFSSFGADNLREIKQLTGQGLSYTALSVLQQQLMQAGFEILHAEQQHLTLYFDNPRAVLKHLRATGVTANSSQFRWSKASLSRFEQDYMALVTPQGVPLCYHPLYIVARSTV